VSAIRLDHAAVATLGVLLDDITWIPEQHAWLDKLDSLIETLPCRLHNPHRIRISQSLVTNVVCLVKVAVESAMVECYINVKDVAVLKNSLVWNSVANDLVWGRAY